MSHHSPRTQGVFAMDMLTAYADAVRRNQGRVEAVRFDQLHGPTPCTEWDVHELIAHIIGGYQMFASALGEPAPTDDPATITDVSDLAKAHQAAADAATAAFNSPGALQRAAVLAIGEATGQVALGLALTDAVVHGWDLATATGQDTSIDIELAAVLLAGAERSINADMRQPHGAMPVFAQPVMVSPDRPSSERLIAFLGRRP